MSSYGIFLLLAVAALAQALPYSNKNQLDAVKLALLGQNRLPSFTTLPENLVAKSKSFLQNIIRSDAKGQDLCGKCKKISESVTTFILDPKTIQKINDTVHQVCDDLLLSVNTCGEVGNLVVYYLYLVLLNLGDPIGYCTCTLQVCPDTEDYCGDSMNNRLPLLTLSKIAQDFHKSSPINKIDTCTICTSALNELKTQLDDPEVVAQLKDVVQQICKYTGAHESQCNDSAKEYYQQFRQALSQPEETCKDAKLCPDQS